MDGLFGKLGLYDFWGVFIAGLISLSAAVLMGSSTLLFDVVPKDHQLVAFLIESYFWGLVLRELSAFADSICFHRQKKAQQVFLNDLKNNPVIKNEIELENYRTIALDICQSSGNANFSEKEQEAVFLYCRSFIEVTKLDGKEKMHNSLLAMSRSLALFFAVLSLCYLGRLFASLYYMGNVMDVQALGAIAVKMFLPLVFAIIFYYRFSWLCRHRVTEVLRRYYALTKRAQSDQMGVSPQSEIPS